MISIILFPLQYNLLVYRSPILEIIPKAVQIHLKKEISFEC